VGLGEQVKAVDLRHINIDSLLGQNWVGCLVIFDQVLALLNRKNRVKSYIICKNQFFGSII